MVNIYVLYSVLGQVIWGLLPLFWMLLQDVPALYILSTRIIWAAIFCYILIVYKHLQPNLAAVKTLSSEWPYIGGDCIAVTMNWCAFIYAMTHGAIIQTSLAYFTSPIIVIFAGALIFHEHLGKLQILSILFAITGLLIAFVLFGQIPYLALFLCLTWATYGLLKKKISVHSQVSVFIESLSMVPLSLAFIGYSEYTGTGAYGVLHGLE